MSSKQIVFERKMQFLNKIKEQKHILFGAFSDKLRKQDKVEKWKEIAVVAQSICLVPVEKDWTYVRDTVWQNFNKTAMLKIDNAKKTGTGGTGMLTEVDNMVLDIIGKESPIICGLGVSESLDQQQTQLSGEPIRNLEASSTSAKPSRKRKLVNGNNIPTEDPVKQEKLQLQVEYLKLKNYRTKLEILKLEKELQLPKSEFTASLQQQCINEVDNGITFCNL